MKLREEENWNIQKFSDTNENTFYNYIIENGNYCIAWVSIQNRININSISKHHFLRSEDQSSPVFNSLPRLLVVTNGKRWFISKFNSNQFEEKNHEQFLIEIHNELKFYHEFLIKNKMSGLVNDIKTSIQNIKKMIRKRGELKNEFSKKDAHALDLDSGEHSYKSMYEVGKMRTDVIERMLNVRNRETHDLKLILHKMLVSEFSELVLQTLVDVAHHSDKSVYLSNQSQDGKLIVKFFENDIYSESFDKNDLYGKYICIDEEGFLSEIDINCKNATEILNIGLFKLNMALLKVLLDKKNKE